MATSSVGSGGRIRFGCLTPLAVKMASRSQEIRPVGAWVELATHSHCTAVVSDGFAWEYSKIVTGMGKIVPNSI